VWEKENSVTPSEKEKVRQKWDTENLSAIFRHEPGGTTIIKATRSSGESARGGKVVEDRLLRKNRKKCHRHGLKEKIRIEGLGVHQKKKRQKKSW